MKTYRMNGDNNHLYFHNMKKRTAREELITIMDILTSQGCVIKDKIAGYDCDLYTCDYNGLRFAISTSTEDGISLCVDVSRDLDVLEALFQNHLEDQTEVYVDYETAYWIAERCFLESDYIGIAESRETIGLWLFSAKTEQTMYGSFEICVPKNGENPYVFTVTDTDGFKLWNNAKLILEKN